MSETPAGQTAPAALSSIGALFSKSWALYRSKLLTLICIVLIGLALGAGLLLLLGGAGFLLTLALPAWKVPLGGLFILLVFFFIIYFICRFQLALLFAVVKEKCGVKEALNSSKGRIGSFFWLGGVTGFILLGGFFLFVIPGLIFTVWFFASPYVFVAEGQKGMNCLLRSRALVSGKWWPVAIRLLLVTIASMLISAIPFVGPILGILFSPFPMITVWTLFQELKAGEGAAPPAPPKGRAAVLLISLLGYVLPIILASFFAVAFFAKAVAAFQRVIPMQIQSAAFKPPVPQGASSKENLLKAATAAVKKRSVDDFMKLCATEGATPSDIEKVRIRAQQIMDAGIETSSVSLVDPGSTKVHTFTEAFGKVSYETDARVKTNIELGGHLEFWIKDGKGAFFAPPFGKKEGKYYVAVSLLEEARAAAAPPPSATELADRLIGKAKTKLSQTPALKRSTGLAHEVRLKNGQVMKVAIAERDEAGMWVELAPGARAYLKNSEIAKITELAGKTGAAEDPAS